MTQRPRPRPQTTTDLATLARRFNLELDAKGLSRMTRKAYADATTAIERYLVAQGRPPIIQEITKEDLQRWLIWERDTHSPGTAASRYAGAVQSFKFAVREGELDVSPMAGISRPKLPDLPPPVLTDAQMDALLKTCDGRSFDDRRDTAIIRTAESTGLRRQELTAIRWTDDPSTNDLDVISWQLRVIRKGNRHDLVLIGSRQARLAIQRYLDLRKYHKDHERNELWLGKNGPLGASGISQMLNRRGAQAGLGFRLHPHQLRHRFADEWLKAKGSEVGLMAAAGWRSRAMLSRYAAANAAERGRSEADDLRIGDRR